MKRTLLNNTSLSQGLVWADAAALVLGLSGIPINAAHAQGKAAAALERVLEKAPEQTRERLEKVLEKQQKKEEGKAGKDDDEKNDDDPKDDDAPGDEEPDAGDGGDGEEPINDGEDGEPPNEGGVEDEPSAGDEPPAGDTPPPDGGEDEMLIADDELLAALIAEAELLVAEEGLVLNLPEGFTLESGTFDELMAELLRFAELAEEEADPEPPVEGDDGLVPVPAL